MLRQKQAQTTVPEVTPARRPKTWKIDISKYKGVEEDSLLLWFVELDRAINVRHIDDEQMKFTFAQTNLAGRAKTWALGLKLHDPHVFGSLEVFKTRFRQTFIPPRAEFRARSDVLKHRQGKRDVHSSSQHVNIHLDLHLRHTRSMYTKVLCVRAEACGRSIQNPYSPPGYARESDISDKTGRL